MERRTVGDREILLEFRHVGEFVKVTAIDPESLREVSIVGSRRAPEAELVRLVIRKLDFIETRDARATPPAKKGKPPSGGGIVV